MIKSGKGGAKTHTGLNFEEKVDFLDLLKEIKGYIVRKSNKKAGVEYVYVLNDWFKDPSYKDVLDYINSVNCHYKFNELPLAWLGLPLGKT